MLRTQVELDTLAIHRMHCVGFVFVKAETTRLTRDTFTVVVRRMAVQPLKIFLTGIRFTAIYSITARVMV